MSKPISQLTMTKVSPNTWRFDSHDTAPPADTFLQLARDRLHKESYQEAENLLLQAIDLDPDNIEALNLSTSLFDQTDRPDLARSTFQRAVETGRKALPSDLVMGEDMLLQFFESNRPLLMSLQGYAQALLCYGDKEEAMKIYRELILYNPPRPALTFTHGVLSTYRVYMSGQET